MKFVLVLGMLVLGSAQNASAADCNCECADWVSGGKANYTSDGLDWSNGCVINQAAKKAACANRCLSNISKSAIRTNANAACAVAANQPNQWSIVSKYRLNGPSLNTNWIESGAPNKIVNCNQQCDGGKIIGGKCYKVPANVQGAPNTDFGAWGFIWNNGLFKQNGAPSCADGSYLKNDGAGARCMKNVFAHPGLNNKNFAQNDPNFFVWQGTIHATVGQPSCPGGQWYDNGRKACVGNATPDNVSGLANRDLGTWGKVDAGKIYKYTPGNVVGSF